MTRRTPKRIEAWAVITSNGHVQICEARPSWALRPPIVKETTVVHLVEADPHAARVVRAAAAHFKAAGSRTHSNDCDVCLAVEALLQSRKKERRK